MLKKNKNNISALNKLSILMIQKVPEFGNKFFYSLGFLSMISFILLLLTGIIMIIFGPNWWLINPVGVFFRSVHLWSTQAFVLFIILHLFVVFSTSGYKKPRTLVWILGVLMFVFVMAETEFGYVLRGDYSSQWRSLQGADFYNGSYLGKLIDTLNYKQMYGFHIVIIPAIIGLILLVHYSLVRLLGLSNPKRANKNIAKTVPANHGLLFKRGGILIIVIVALAIIFPSPFLKPVTIKEIAISDPSLLGKTLTAELNSSSDTATYMDSINPYTFSTKNIYIDNPYKTLLTINPQIKNQLTVFNNLPEDTKTSQISQLVKYYEDSSNLTAPKTPTHDLINSLVQMAATGLYEQNIANSNDTFATGNHTTYVLRFLADTGVLEEKATTLNLTTDQYGMLHEESSKNPVGAWWLAPIGLAVHTIFKNDSNGDRDTAVLIGLFILLLIAFPYIPYVNKIPEKLKMYKLFQR
jgi:Cytochrome b(N-terminal)/b6/petB